LDDDWYIMDSVLADNRKKRMMINLIMNSKKGKDETYDMKTNDQSTIFARHFVMALLK